MRGYLASSVGVACATALVIPLSLASGAFAASLPAAAVPQAQDVPGSTQSLPLKVIGQTPSDRSAGTPELGLPEQDVDPFSLVGVVWEDAFTELNGTVEVRTRAAWSGVWTDWQQVETHTSEHAADPGTAESESRSVRGATAPLWVGASDGVEVRVRAEDGTSSGLPEGMRLELVDPGEDPAAADPATDTAPEPDTVPRTAAADPGTGTALEPDTASGTGTAPEPDTAPEPGTAPGTDTAPEPGTALEPDTASGTGTAPGTDTAPEPDTAPGTDTAPDPGTSPGTGTAPGTDTAPDPDTSPGTDTAPEPDADQGAEGPDAEPTGGRSPVGGLEIPALDQADTEAEAATVRDMFAGELAAGAKPYIGPRPRIVTRKGWGADESWREKKFVYTRSVKAAFVHHSATGNNYTCKQAPSVLRSIYRYHVKSSGWRDIGYNFAVDKCGNIYEGRAGGVAKPVLGAHTLGFNTNSTGIAVLGTYSSSNPPQAAVTAVAKLTAWKLGLHGINPNGKVTLTSAGSGKYAKGVKVKLNAISGHRDGYVTDCPGGRLYSRLGTARTAAAKLQGR